jgi:ABC-type antimicrobial peptide transport system permease subunit
MGLRMALGAARGGVIGMIMRQGLGLASIGAVIGLAGAFGLTRVLENQLFGVGVTDPITYGFVTALLIGIAALATIVPALRATRVDPIVALRSE